MEGAKMESALKLIIAKCNSYIAEEAIRTMAAMRSNSPVLQIRYLSLLQRALSSDVEWTPEERIILAEAVEAPDTSAAKNFTLRLRITSQEHGYLKSQADEAGLSVSEYVRRKIL
jgi:hypothetical protein